MRWLVALWLAMAGLSTTAYAQVYDCARGLTSRAIGAIGSAYDEATTRFDGSTPKNSDLYRVLTQLSPRSKVVAATALGAATILMNCAAIEEVDGEAQALRQQVAQMIRRPVRDVTRYTVRLFFIDKLRSASPTAERILTDDERRVLSAMFALACRKAREHCVSQRELQRDLVPRGQPI